MSIVSLAFFLFVSIVVLLYFIIPVKYRWIVLLAGSYVFYWFNGKWLVLILLGETLVTYLIGLWIQKVNDRNEAFILTEGRNLPKEERKELKAAAKKRARRILVLGVACDLGLLLFLRYYNFMGGSLNRLLTLLGAEGNVIPHLDILVPLGISFYTLQAISYLTDIYREKITIDRNPFIFMLFMSFFPQIVQGPIPRHSQLAHQLYQGNRFDYKQFCFGAQLVLWGLMKKLIIADRLAVAVNTLFTNYKTYYGPIVFLGAALYGIQVYADFSGGMDIALGVAEMMGIRLEKNFSQPYFASSVENFWRRWHMTLGSWMKDYVFYPLSLSKAFTKLGRKSRKLFGQYIGKRLPSILAMFIVFLLVGIWHGSGWNYLAYGVWNSIFIVSGILLQRFWQNCRGKMKIREETFAWKAFCMVRTFIIISAGRFFSHSQSLTAALVMFKHTIVRFWDFTFLGNGTLLKLGLKGYDWIILLIAVIILFAFDAVHEKGIRIREEIARRHLVFRWAIYLAAILLLLLFGMYGSSQSSASFIYEQF